MLRAGLYLVELWPARRRSARSARALAPTPPPLPPPPDDPTRLPPYSIPPLRILPVVRCPHQAGTQCHQVGPQAGTVRQVLKLTEPPECFARLIVLLLYRWAYGLVFLKAAAERVSETKVVGLTQFIPWSSGSWKFGPMPEELAFQALESFKLVPNSAYSDSSLQAASLTILESCVAIYGLKI